MKIMVNERGQRIGEGHPNAKYPDSVIDHILALRDAGYSYGVIVRKTGIPKTTVAYICRGDRRAQKGAVHERARARPAKKVRLQVLVPLLVRTIISKNGGDWLAHCVLEAERTRTAKLTSSKTLRA